MRQRELIYRSEAQPGRAFQRQNVSARLDLYTKDKRGDPDKEVGISDRNSRGKSAIAKGATG